MTTIKQANRSREHAPTPKIRVAHDAGDDARLRRDPTHADAKLDVALDESFPSSDPPAGVQPGKGKDAAPSSGYDEGRESARANGRPGTPSRIGTG